METYTILWCDAIVSEPYSGVCFKTSDGSDSNNRYWFILSRGDGDAVATYHIYPLETSLFQTIDAVNAAREQTRRQNSAKGGFSVTSSANITSYMQKTLQDATPTVIPTNSLLWGRAGRNDSW